MLSAAQDPASYEFALVPSSDRYHPSASQRSERSKEIMDPRSTAVMEQSMIRMRKFMITLKSGIRSSSLLLVEQLTRLLLDLTSF